METLKSVAQGVHTVVTSAVQSGTEPPSGQTGASTIDSPYDQGNATEPSSTTEKLSGIEPPSGQQGKGTIDEPYDQGNAPVQVTASGTEPPSGQQGKGTIDQPYDQGNQPEQSSNSQIAQSVPASAVIQPNTSSSTAQPESTNSTMDTTKEQTQAVPENRGRHEAPQTTTSTAEVASSRGGFDTSKSGAGDAAHPLGYEERDVSPGELRDGTHAKTSGDRGEVYQPGKLSKLKDKFGFGRDRKG